MLSPCIVAPTIEDWSVSERTQVREEVSQTTRTEGILHAHSNSSQYTHAVLNL